MPYQGGAGRPRAAAASAICSFVWAKRRAEQKIASQPSPYRAARRTAASPFPPMTIGTGGSGAGLMRAEESWKNSPA